MTPNKIPIRPPAPVAHRARRAALARGSATVVLALLALPLFAAPSDLWPGFRGPAGNGRASSGSEEPASGLQVGWKRPLGSGYCGLAIAGESLVTCAQRGEVDVLLALDQATGEERWAISLGAAMLGHGGSLDGGISTPAIANGTVYGFGPRGDFVAIELATGAERWRRNLATEDATVPYYGFASSPLVVGDLVVVQVGGEAGALVAFERDTGEVAWNTFADLVEAQSPKLIEIHGKPQIVFASNEFVAGVDPEEGALLWRWAFTAQDAQTLSTSPLAVGDGGIFASAGPNRGVLLRPPVVSTGGEGVPEPSVSWDENILSRTYSPATVVGDQLVGYTSRFLGGYSIETGETLWRSREPGDGFLIAVDDQVVIITKDGSLHLGDVAGGWQERSSVELFDDIVWTPPSYADDAVFVRSMTEIARVDLVRREDPVTQEPTTDQRVTESMKRDTPARLQELLEGDPADLDQRIDTFLEKVTTPILDGQRALFLWRGDATDVGIAGDFLGMRIEGAFRQLGDSDLWWYEVDVAPRLQYTYILYVDFEPTLDPLNPERMLSSVMGPNANWARPAPVEMSYFAMPDWPGPPAHLRPDAPAPEQRGRLSEVKLDLSSAQLDGIPPEVRERLATVDVWLPPGYDESAASYPTVYAFEWDGLRHPEAGRWIETLDATAGRLYRAPIVVFVQRLPRGFEFAQLVATVDSSFRTLRDREARAVVAWAFAGIEAFLGAGRNIDLIGKLGVQSQHGFVDDIATLSDAIPAPTSDRPFVAYLDWGTLDSRSPSEGWDMSSIARGIFEALQAKGVEVRGGEVEATSDWKSWRNRTHEMLAALFPL